MKKIINLFQSLLMGIFVGVSILIVGMIAGSEIGSTLIFIAIFYCFILSFIVSFSNTCAEENGFGFISLIIWIVLFLAAYILGFMALFIKHGVENFADSIFNGLYAAFLPTSGICMFYYYRMLGMGESDIEGGNFIEDTFGLLKRPLLIYLACAVVATLLGLAGDWLVYTVCIAVAVFGVGYVIFMRVKNGSILH